MENREGKKIANLVDVIDCYPVRNRAAVYLALESVNRRLGSIMPYVGFEIYEADYQEMVELLATGATDERLEPLVQRLSEDMRTLLDVLESALAEWDGDSPFLEENPEEGERQLCGVYALYAALEAILVYFHTLTPAAINRLVDGPALEGGPYRFVELELIGNELINRIRGSMR